MVLERSGDQITRGGRGVRSGGVRPGMGIYGRCDCARTGEAGGRARL
jgi:hypothetical protein